MNSIRPELRRPAFRGPSSVPLPSKLAARRRTARRIHSLTRDPLARSAGKHSFKYSGLANRNSNVGVTEENGAVTIMLGSKKNGIKSQKTAVKKNARRAAHAAGAVAAKRRPDLVNAAKAKAGALSRGLRARKARSA